MQSVVRRLQDETSSCFMTYEERLIKWIHDEETHQNKIRIYVFLSTALLAILFLLSVFKKRFWKVWLNFVSVVCYLMVPILLSYTLALMGEPGNSLGFNTLYKWLYSVWSVLLLLGYASFDNLSVFSPEERNARSKLVFQFLIQVVLILLFAYTMYWRWKGPVLLAFLLVCFKVVERIVALAYAANVTPGIKQKLRKMINYINKDEEGEVDPVTMKGFKYLVGPRYSESHKDGVIVEGISVENIWECKGRLLSSESGGGDQDGKLKDTCLSFALFWLLLGKLWGYHLFKGGDSRGKAWKLVRDGLFVGGSERVFRVIELELSFLQDFFFSKYTFFYFNGFYWKLYVFTYPIMFWGFTRMVYTLNHIDNLHAKQFGTKIEKQYLKVMTTQVVILVLFVLEVFQLIMVITSGWFRVSLLSYYAKRDNSKKCRLLDCCFEKVINVISRILLRFHTILFPKPWKRELDQYSLLQSSTSFSIDNKLLRSFAAVFGIPGLPIAGRKKASSVVLSENVKTAVVLALQKNGPHNKLSNGIASLRRNEVEKDLSWACKLGCDIEAILVWHIATSICEMRRESQQNSKQSTEDFEVATTLSKYCAYLLLFCPSLLHVSLLEAEATCDIAIQEARDLFKKPVSPCGFVEEVDKYEKLMELLSDNEAEAQRATTIRRGAKLGQDLLFTVKDEGRRWKILAEFWTEMILFLASSNSNEMVHVERLAEGGEFITLLWALLIHAGIVDRDTI